MGGIAAGVGREEQDAFNRKAVRSIGHLKARLTLVGFYDALYGEGGKGKVGCGGVRRVTPDDRRRFAENIPAPVRGMLPIWRRGAVGRWPMLFGDR